MKSNLKILLFSLSAVLIISGCSSTKKVFYDDVYFSLDDADRETRTYNSVKKVKSDITKYTPVNGNQDDGIERDQDGNLIIKNNYADDSQFSFDDYYDYSYTSRIRRFHGNNTWSYYDPYYTNYYWYNQNPHYFGNSLYNSYSFWGPGYSYSYYSISYSWGSGWNNPWYNPYYSYYNWNNPWYNSWGSGYWWNPYDPFCNGGWNSPWYSYPGSYGMWNNGFYYGNLYFNSYDQNTYYYGPRQNSPTNGQISFSRVMQDNGIQQDFTNRPVLHVKQPVINNQNATSGNNSIESFTKNPNNNSNVRDNNSGTSVTNNSANKFSTYNRETSGNVSNNNTLIITNEDPNTSGNLNRNNVNTNDTPVRKWDNNSGNVIIIDKNVTNKNNSQRSGTFSEGSRTSGENNSGFFERNPVQQNIQPKNNNTIIPRQNTNPNGNRKPR